MGANQYHSQVAAADAVNRAKAIASPPATCLLLLALLTLLFECVVGYTVVVDTLRFLEYYGVAEGWLRAAPFTLSFAFVFVMHLVVFTGAISMGRLSHYRFAKVAAIIALAPVLSPGYVLGIPFGVWALLALRKPAVKQAFQAGCQHGV